MGSWPSRSTNSTDMPWACRAPQRSKQREHDVLAARPGLEPSGEDHPARAGRGEVDVARGPPEAQGGGTHADPHRAVGAVGAAVGIRPGDERAGMDQPLLGEVEVEDPVAGGGEVGFAHPLVLGELLARWRCSPRPRPFR